MISLNTPYISQQPHTEILINQHLTVQAAANLNDYNFQYLRRMLRSGKLEGIKISQIWLKEMESLESAENKLDLRCGLRD
jgi:hypothetical protein